MLDVGALRRDRARAKLTYAGEEVTLLFKPSGITHAWEDKAQLATQDMGHAHDALLEVLAAWDIREDGDPVPLTAESLQRLPSQLVAEMLAAVVKEVRPSNKELEEVIDRLRLYIKTPKIAEGEDPDLFSFGWYRVVKDARYAGVSPQEYLDMPSYMQDWIHISRAVDQQLENEANAKANKKRR